MRHLRTDDLANRCFRWIRAGRPNAATEILLSEIMCLHTESLVYACPLIDCHIFLRVLTIQLQRVRTSAEPSNDEQYRFSFSSSLDTLETKTWLSFAAVPSTAYRKSQSLHVVTHPIAKRGQTKALETAEA